MPHRKHKKKTSFSRIFVASLIVIGVFIVLYILFGHFNTIAKGGDWASLTLNYNNSRYQSNSTLTAYNINAIQQKWFFNTSSWVTSTPMVLNGKVYFGDWAGNVFSLNIANGQKNWETSLGEPISSTPTLANGDVYVGAGPYGPPRVFALSQGDGHIIWNTTLNSVDGGVWGSPTIFDGLLYIGVAGTGGFRGGENATNSAKGEMFALNVTTGKIVWNFTTMIGTSAGAGVWSSAVVDPLLNSIYFGTGNAYLNTTNSMYAYSIISLNATTGTLNWAYSVYNSVVYGDDYDFGETPNLFSMNLDGKTYNAIGEGSKNGKYYILDRTNGSLLQTQIIGYPSASGGIIGLSGFTYNELGEPELFIPSYYNYTPIACCGVIEALSPSDNKIDWRVYTSGNIRGAVTIIPGAVVVGDTKGNMLVLSSNTGQEFLHEKFSNGIQAGITIAEGYVLVPTSSPGPNNTAGLYAFGSG